MKRKLSIALSLMMAASAVPVYASKDFADTYTAKAGTMDFRKNDVLQPLDAEIYMKDGHVMLPLRTFLKAVDENATLTWHPFEVAQAEMNGHNAVFAMEDNMIHVDGKRIAVSGTMELKEGRLFVPLRNWGKILQLCGYHVEENGIIWDDTNKTATVIISQMKTSEEMKVDFSMELTNKYDEIENAGNGLFIAEKYMEDDIGLGQGHSSSENEYYLIDSTGKIYLKYESDSIHNLQSLNDGLFLVKSKDRSKFDQVIDKNGTVIFESPYDSISPFYEGLAQVSSDSFSGFVDKNGNPVITIQLEYAENFSEGFAAICIGVDLEEKTAKWNYVDKNGKYINDKAYRNCQSFSDGMGRIITKDGVGYIDRSGNEVIKPQYKWGSPFKNGRAYVQQDTNEILLINKLGEEVKPITKVNEDDYVGVDENAHILIIEEIIDLPDGEHQHKQTYFDEKGKVSREEYRMRKESSEGYAPVYDEKKDKYGYAFDNCLVISPMFDEVEPFRDGYAVVRNGLTLNDGEEDVEWGIIKCPMF